MIGTDSENALWLRVKERETNSFRQFFDLFYPSLCEYARQFVKDAMDAEDITLDLFIYLWKNLDRINVSTSIRSYLFTSVKNRCLNHLRSLSEPVPLDGKDIPVLDPALEDIDTEAVSLIISAALETLSERSQSVFRKKRDEGLTNAEIAEEFGISEKAVEAHVTKVLKKLRVAIKKNYLFSLF